MPVISDITIGDTITFRSKAVNDNNFYHGKVIGKVTSDVAQMYADIFTYNSSVQSADNTVGDVSTQTFLIIKLLEQIDDKERYIIPFSEDWVNVPSLNIIATNRIATIRVFEVDSTNIQDVLNVLATAGFTAKLDSLS